MRTIRDMRGVAWIQSRTRHFGVVTPQPNSNRDVD